MKNQKKTLTSVSLLFGMLFSSCQSYITPPMAVHKSVYTQLKPEEKELFPSDISELTLEDAQALALENNPDFLSIRFSIDSARARYYQSFSSYAPTLNAGMSISQSFSKMYMSENTSKTRNQSESYRPSLSGNWLIFDCLAREMNILSTRYELKQAISARDDAKRLLLRAVAYAYNAILLDITQISIAQAEIDYAKKMLAEAQNKYDAGTGLLTDVLNFKISLHQGELNKIKTQHSLESDKYVLAGYLGITDGTIPENVTFPEIQAKDIILANVEIYLDEALQNRPDLRQIREGLKAAKYSYWKSFSAFGPTVSANFELGYGTNHNVPKSGGNTWTGTGSFSYGLNANWNLFNGFSDYMTMKAALANLAKQDYTLAKTWIDVVTDVRTSYDNCINYMEQEKVTKTILDLTKQTRDMVENEYLAGTALVTRLNEAERDLLSASNNLALATINTSNAKAQLEASIAALSNSLPVGPYRKEQATTTP